MSTLGFIGLGHMGAPMASNLLKEGHSLYVYDVVSATMELLSKQGAHVAKSIGDLVSHADIVLSSVQTGQQVREICLMPEGLFSHAKAGLLYIDCSSIDIVTTQFLHQEAEKLNIGMLDAPVSGGVGGAKTATLTFMVGGSEENFNRALPILKSMGKKIVHAGSAGHGQAAKICNNLLLAVSMIGVCESFTLAQKLGLDPKRFFEISSNASGQCWSMTSYCPYPGIIENVPANNDYQPGFTAKMMLKDLRLAQHAAESANASIPLGAEAAEIYNLFVNQGFGGLDFSGVINFLAGKKI